MLREPLCPIPHGEPSGLLRGLLMLVEYKCWPFSFSALSLWKESSFQAKAVFHSPASLLYFFKKKSVNILSDPADKTPKLVLLWKYMLGCSAGPGAPCGPGLLGASPAPSEQGSSHCPSQEQSSRGSTGTDSAPGTSHFPGDEASITAWSCGLWNTQQKLYLQNAGVLFSSRAEATYTLA